MARVIFSPATEPMEAPRKLKSMTARETGRPFILPMPAMTVSLTPVFFTFSASFSAYLGNLSGSFDERLASNSFQVPSSMSSWMRRGAPSAKW